MRKSRLMKTKRLSKRQVFTKHHYKFRILKPKLLIMTQKLLLRRAAAFVLLLFAVVQHVCAQGRVVTGKVTDGKDGSPVSGASVQIKGTNRGTVTDAAGLFRISVDDNNAVLVITSVGFSRLEMPVGTQNDVAIGLTATSGNLNEVVVVGYGTQRKKDLTGAIATISSKDFVKGALQTPEQLISGKVAGVQITPNNGAPGSGSRIRIRGGASFGGDDGGSNDPLIVIDGVPVENRRLAGSANPLNLINPNDIETFTILKDPSSAAIYGSRASNGVILITTKKGKKGKLRFNFNAQGFVQTPSGKVDILSPDEFRTVINQNGTPSQIAQVGKENTDWQDEIYRNAFAQDFNLSATGAFANGKWPFRISGGYLNQDGLLLTSNFNRLNGSINLSPRFLNDKLKVDINLKMSRTANRFADEGAVGQAVTFDPTKPVRSGNNRLGGYWEWIDGENKPMQLSNRNPVGFLEMQDNSSEVFRSISNIQLDYQIPFIKGLRANLNLGYDFQRGSGLDIIVDSAAREYRVGGRRNPYVDENKNRLAEFYFNYVKDVKSIKSRIDAMLGTSYQQFDFYTKNFRARSFNGQPAPNSQEPRFLSNSDAVNGDRGYTILSYYARVNYTLANKYILTLNARSDGSSRFGPLDARFLQKPRWAVFPGVALAWRVSEESFLKNSKVVSDLKIRAGYGRTGQQDLGDRFYNYIASYGISNNSAQYQLGNTFYNMVRPDAYDTDLRWETTTNTNVAVDFGFFDNRLSGTIEGFVRETKDLLSVVPVPAGSNFTNRLVTNVGSIESKGFEATLNVVPVRNKDLEWNFSVNFTYVVPEITKLLINPDPNFTGIAVGGISGGTGNTIQRHLVGQRPNSFYVYKQVYNKNNKPIEGLYEDLNRDGIINDKDLYVYNNPEPRYFIGASSSVDFKRFTAGFVLRANLGNYMYNNFASNSGVLRSYLNPLGFIANGSRDFLNTGFQNNQYFSDYYIQNASFLRIDNINLGYDAGEIAKNVRLRITANVQNAFIITKYTGLDPEISGGIDNNIFPRPRTYVLGLNLDF
jgi:iron complex outermembrane receptor protein